MEGNIIVMKKILLVDGNLLLFRSFYAAQAIVKDQPINMGIHLFFNTFLEIFKKANYEYVFFAFDAIGPTWRHNEYDQYKSGRKKAPEDLYKLKEIIFEILNIMKISFAALTGDEADDLIATLCVRYKKDFFIDIFSEDKDLLQLIDNNVDIIMKNKDKSIKDKYAKISIDNFYSIFNFYPEQIVDYKSIAGDNSDNLPGITGIGPKQTIDLLRRYKNIENIYLNIGHLSPKQQELFSKNKEQALLCKKLATLNTNVNISNNLDDMLVKIENIKNDNVFNILNKYYLKKIWNIISNLNNNL